MKKVLLAMVAAAAMISTGAMAQSIPAGLFVGAGGSYVKSTTNGASSTGAVNLRVGYELNKYIDTELDVSAGFASGNQRASTATVLNVVAGYPVDVSGVNLKPYALVGTGYDFSSTSSTNNNNTNPVFNVGGGLMYNVTENVALDLRYTYIDGYNKNSGAANMVGMNVNYKF